MRECPGRLSNNYFMSTILFNIYKHARLRPHTECFLKLLLCVTAGEYFYVISQLNSDATTDMVRCGSILLKAKEIKAK